MLLMGKKMEVREAHDVEQYIFSRWIEEELKPREGIHLSDLDLCLGKAYYRKTDEKEGRRVLPSNELLLLFMLGWAMQHEVLGVPEEEMELDGIKMSVDAPFNGEFIEFKTTRLSAGKFSFDEHPNWIMRTKGYCHARGITKGFIVIIFLNGDYKPPRPMMKAFELEFTPEELQSNWLNVRSRKEILEEAIEHKSYPSTDYHAGWECKRCEHNVPGRCMTK